MAKFKVTFNNIAGELSEKTFDVAGDGEDGLPFAVFADTLNEWLHECPVHDGDSFTVELVQ